MYTCVAVGFPDPTGRGFVIPMFVQSNSNALFVQSVDLSGRVTDFSCVSDDVLRISMAVPPPIQVSTGDQRVIAFIDDADQLHIGTDVEISRMLRSKEVQDPFTRLEIADLLQDASMYGAALEDGCKLFENQKIASHWKKREVKLFKKIVYKKDEVGDDVNREKEFSILMDALEFDDNISNWTDIWHRLWTQNFERKKLIGIAYLRQDRRININNSISIFFAIYEYIDDKESFNRLLIAFDSSEIFDRGWLQTFNKLLFRRYWDETLVQFGLMRLLRERDFDKVDASWVSLWHSIFNKTDQKNQMIELAISYINNISNISSFAAKVLFIPISRRRHNLSLVQDVIRDWLVSYPRSDTVWSRLFIKIYRGHEDPELHEVGMRWLATLGGNVNTWMSIWRAYSPHLSRAETEQLALSWLERARRDMRTWAEVYLEIYEMRQHEDPRKLLTLAKSWIESTTGANMHRRRVLASVKVLTARLASN